MITINTVDRYYIHIPIMEILDQQHSEMRCMLQDLRRSILEKRDLDQIIACSKDLVDSIIEHVYSEENAMAANNFADLDAHRRLHVEIIDSAIKIWNDLEHWRISDATEHINFLDVRIAYHLGYEDGNFGRNLRGEE